MYVLMVCENSRYEFPHLPMDQSHRMGPRSWRLDSQPQHVFLVFPG